MVAVAFLLLCTSADAAIRYEVSLAHPEMHLFHVSMEVPDVNGEVNLQMAAWNALYEIRDFSSHVQRVQAFANGQAAPIEKLDKLTWHVQGRGTVTVKYDTFWDDVGPFNSQLNAEHAFINPAMILLYVANRRDETCSLNLDDAPPGWKAVSAILGARIVSLAASGHSLFEAASFDALADAQFVRQSLRLN